MSIRPTQITFSIVAILTMALCGCSNDMNAGEYTFACENDRDCASGFFCGPDNVCVEDGATIDTGPSDADAGPEDASDAEDTADVDDTADTTDVRDTDATEDTRDGDADDAGDEDVAEDADTCTPTTWYRDEDGDGFGANDTAQESCESPGPTNWVQMGDDCDDSDVRAFPGQSEMFETQRNDGSGFDFDCDGEATPKFDTVSTGCVEASGCQIVNTTCNPTPDVIGWRNSLAGCGEQNAWVTGCSDSCVSSCTDARIVEDKTQACN